MEKHGNAEAGAAADTSRRHQFKILIDAKRKLPMARNHWCPIMLDLHLFMIDVARDSLNQNCKGCTALDRLVWDQRRRPKVRKLAVRLMLILRFSLAHLVS